ncbi:MAG: hypothetical protein IMY72_11830 [Bacteroidetes bacterium]|nr:hypothetical protein [Bacteroidota bacterium]
MIPDQCETKIKVSDIVNDCILQTDSPQHFCKTLEALFECYFVSEEIGLTDIDYRSNIFSHYSSLKLLLKELEPFA